MSFQSHTRVQKWYNYHMTLHLFTTKVGGTLPNLNPNKEVGYLQVVGLRYDRGNHQRDFWLPDGEALMSGKIMGIELDANMEGRLAETFDCLLRGVPGISAEGAVSFAMGWANTPYQAARIAVGAQIRDTQIAKGQTYGIVGDSGKLGHVVLGVHSGVNLSIIEGNLAALDNKGIVQHTGGHALVNVCEQA